MMAYKTKLVLRNLADCSRCLPVFNLSDSEKAGAFRTFTYLKLTRRTLELPLGLGRTVRGARLGDRYADVYADCAFKLLKSDNNPEVRNAICADILRKYQSESCQTIGGSLGDLTPSGLENYPLWSLVLPWSKQTVEERIAKYPPVLKKNRVQNGLQAENLTDDQVISTAYSFSGAMSQVMQFQRVAEIVKAGKFSDIESGKSPPAAIVLRDGNRWRWMMGDEGNHRAYVLAASGVHTILVRVSRIIDRQRILEWSNVRNGCFTAEQADLIFHQFFEGSADFKGLL